MKENESHPTETANPTVWERVKPWIYMVVMFLSIMLCAKIFVGKVQKKQSSDVETADTVNVVIPQ